MSPFPRLCHAGLRSESRGKVSTFFILPITLLSWQNLRSEQSKVSLPVNVCWRRGVDVQFQEYRHCRACLVCVWVCPHTPRPMIDPGEWLVCHAAAGRFVTGETKIILIVVVTTKKSEFSRGIQGEVLWRPGVCLCVLRDWCSCGVLADPSVARHLSLPCGAEDKHS